MSKKDVQHQARILRQSAHFDPANTTVETPAELLRTLNQEIRNDRAFEAAGACSECARLRKDDPEALCREHLRQALGF